MRLIDTKTGEQKQQDSGISFLDILMSVIMAAVSYSSILLAPLGSLLCEIRLPAVWAKPASLGAAALALVLFDVPLAVAIPLYVSSIYYADGVKAGRPLFLHLAASVTVSLLSWGGTVLALAYIGNTGVLQVWNQGIQTIVENGKILFPGQSDPNWKLLQFQLRSHGPLLLFCFTVLGLWISTGMAAHLGWLQQSKIYSSDRLRAIRIPRFVGVFFVLLIAARFLNAPIVLDGALAVASLFMFIQGTISLSVAMNGRVESLALRGLIYGLGIIFGFYVVIAIGVWNSVFARRIVPILKTQEEV